MSPVRRALISLSDKTHLEELAKVLLCHEVEVLSTGGTYRALCELGLSPIKVSDFTGCPEILDGRVKTLHPKIHGGILALPQDGHQQQLRDHGMVNIDLVVVNLYPFSRTVAQPDCSFTDAIENIDIGGPAMLRSAAKNWNRVGVIVDPEDYLQLGKMLASHEGQLPESFRRNLARKAFSHTANYDAAIANYLHRWDDNGKPADSDRLPERIFFSAELEQPLRYGENPQQKAAFYRGNLELLSSEDAQKNRLDPVQSLQGKPLSYNNLLDANAAIELIQELAVHAEAPACVVIKHVSPCGAAIGRPGSSMAETYVSARDADSESAFGGIVAVSDVVDRDTANRMIETFLEVVIAPGYTDEASELLASKKNLRVLIVDKLRRNRHLPDASSSQTANKLRLRSVAHGWLIQDQDQIQVYSKDGLTVTRKSATEDELRSLDLALVVSKHAQSNAIVVAKDGVTVGIGAGQTSRVEAVRQALRRAGDHSKGAVVASDAFFPFADSIELFASMGIRAVVQPGGSIRDNEVIACADKHGLAMVFTKERHFRH